MKQSFFARIYSHPKADYVILFFLVIGITILNQVWLMNEPRPPHWDMARHLYNSLQYWSFFTHLDVGHFLFSYFYYPPFLYWITQPFYLIFGRSISVAVLANDLVFLPILLYSTYGLGKELWNRRTGL